VISSTYGLPSNQLRNAIVHVYWKLDYRAIYRASAEQLADLDEFARQVRAYLA
jgi:uncharacterized protein YutE (UPF0331/DUF86 family)